MSKRIYLSIPHMEGAELKYVQEAFVSNWLSTAGPNLDAVEAEFSKLVGRSSVALCSGTAAMHLGIKLLGLKDGDEVITPTLTFGASCNPLLYERAVPIFIDSDRTSWNLDPHLLAEFLKKRAKVNRLPKAVMAVHLFGQSADLDPILETCRQYDLPLIEDAAESLGAEYKGRNPGSFGDVGIYSFNGNKIITGTAGGMLVSPRKEWVEKARYWSTHARDPGLGYLHSEPGYNYRLSNVLAGIVRGQLEVLPLRVAQRRAVAFRYREALAEIGFTLMPQAPYGLHTNWLSCFLIDEERFGLTQMQLIKHLETHNIESRPVWKPMHTQKLYEPYECIGGAVAEDVNRHGICLPSSSSLSEDDQQFVIGAIQRAHRQSTSLRNRYPANGL
ncbi:MAG TPA: DegT/DnrJ/EryC1/StrS family aminotransferase [Verrucomicrobiae bacterium]|nr:DegT/DnrJ/EryC1/StrS family aminotransferase [Verrucomicrobiae bacterium]